MTTSHGGSADDVRMRGFARRDTVEAAIAWLDAQLHRLPSETLPIRSAAGRVLAESITSDIEVPGFDRAMMDGYAVVAESTDGATEYNRLPLQIIGESLPGRAFSGLVGAGQAVRIMTGAPMPRGANAVLPAEWVSVAVTLRVTSALDTGATLGLLQTTAAGDHHDPKGTQRDGYIDATAALSPEKHVGKRGEDVAAGSQLFESGRALRPQDLGLLSSVGIAQVAAIRKPLVRLVITGNELLPAGSPPHGCRVADANGPMLAALVERDGGIVDFPGLVPDDRESILSAIQSDADVVIVSGGSSVGEEDFVPTLLAEHGELAIHGIAMRPSSPTGMGKLGDRLVFLLPGNPVSCLCAYDFFAGRAIRALGGRAKQWPYRSFVAPLARKISSPIGRLDYARVQWIENRLEPISIGGASILSSTTRADGFVIVPADSEGYPPGSEVEVWLYD